MCLASVCAGAFVQFITGLKGLSLYLHQSAECGWCQVQIYEFPFLTARNYMVVFI